MMDAAPVVDKSISTLCNVAHVVDVGQHYPGDDVTLFSRIKVFETLPGFVFRVSIPDGLIVSTTLAPQDALPQVGVGTGVRHLVWRVDRPAPAGVYEYRVVARVAPTLSDLKLQSRAVVTVEVDDGTPVSDQETATIFVRAKSRYVAHLPGIYDGDELMGRFLMIFESLWKPKQDRIDHLEHYFDPKTAPPGMLPWLASWLGMRLDADWPEERQRMMIQSAISLYRKKGTKEGLKAYLETLTGGKVRIVEHRAHNFVFGVNTRLGPGIALGINNHPNTFTVHVRLPPLEAPAGESWSEQEVARRELERRKMIQNIIDEQKPAHTGYTLHVETGPDDQEMEE